MKIEVKQKLARYWFCVLQDVICLEVEKLEKEHGSNIKFKKNKWKHGEFRTIKGEVIEKGGVAFSNVVGRFPKEFAKKIPGTNSNNTNYWSSGISACIDENKEKKFFHDELKKICDIHNKRYYPKYKKWCDRYFYLPHRGETRGIGGIFFDYKMDNWKKDFSFTKDVGNTFIHIVKEIIRKKMFKRWTKKEKEIQLLKRGRYIEFNLLYDRGTKFGLHTGGNPESILMSMPPMAKWK